MEPTNNVGRVALLMCSGKCGEPTGHQFTHNDPIRDADGVLVQTKHHYGCLVCGADRVWGAEAAEVVS